MTIPKDQIIKNFDDFETIGTSELPSILVDDYFVLLHCGSSRDRFMCASRGILFRRAEILLYNDPGY